MAGVAVAAGLALAVLFLWERADFFVAVGVAAVVGPGGALPVALVFAANSFALLWIMVLAVMNSASNADTVSCQRGVCAQKSISRFSSKDMVMVSQ